MASTVNYEDLYDDFVRLVSPSTSDLPPTLTSAQSPTGTSVNDQISESLDKSPLRVLTPPSPISESQPNPVHQDPSIEQNQLVYLELSQTIKDATMCDNSQGSTAPSIVVSTASGNHGTTSNGKTVETISISNSVANGQGFLSMMLSQAPSNVGNVQSHHNLSNGGMGGQHSAQSHMHPPIHSMQGGSCSTTMQQHILDGHHHHVQPISMAHQQHQLGLPPPHHGHNSQQYVSYGMPFGSNTMGNGNSYPNHLNPYHPQHHPQIPNQQPAHAMSMNLQGMSQSCFMQHPGGCMHFQPGNPAIPAALNNQRGSTVGWINGGTNSSAASMATQVQGHLVANYTGGQNGGPKALPGAIAKMPAAMIQDPNAVPSGLEILWRELPVDCQKLFMQQDIPDSAKFRGYFTVAELLVLKRILQSRYAGAESAKLLPVVLHAPPAPAQKMPFPKITQGGVTKEKGSTKRGGSTPKKPKEKRSPGESGKGKGSKRKSQQQDTGINSTNEMVASSNPCEPEMMHEDTDDNNSQNGELMISLDSMKHEVLQTSAIPMVTGYGVGGAVKEAMDALVSTQTTETQSAGGFHGSPGKEPDTSTLPSGKDQAKSPSNDEPESTNNESERESDGLQKNPTIGDLNRAKESNALMTVLPMLPSMLPNFSGLFGDKKGENSPVPISSPNQSQGCEMLTEENKGENGSLADSHKQLVLALNSMSGESLARNATQCQIPMNTTISQGCYPSSPISHEPPRYAIPPPPPYRTATLVVKLLQIGAYQIRSFSNVNPNRLRVLFNTQRMMYECQLPVLPPPPGSPPGATLTRKVLTVDIGFEQITMLKFGHDSLCMRVDGPPLLTISVNVVQDEPVTQGLNHHDHHLLEQIEKGQLKLSPIHQLYFLNERLVNLLESQFREHPRFRPLLMQVEVSHHGRYQSQ